MKKIFISFVIISLFNYLACTTLNVASKETIKEEAKNGKLHGEIYIITNDHNRYLFGEWGYHIENDTLYGKGLKINPNGEEPFDGKIAMDYISHFEVEETDPMATTGVILGVAAFALLVFGIISLIAFNDSIDSCSQK